MSRLVMQDWLAEIPMMQQTVLLAAIRGPDGLTKYGSHKMLLRWYRRCILLSAMDGAVITDPCSSSGGSFTGPSLPYNWDGDDWRPAMDEVVGDYMKNLDGMPLHFHNHLFLATEILGYKHPDKKIRDWWNAVYVRIVSDFHLHPETEAELDKRLGDTREGWLERADPATTY